MKIIRFLLILFLLTIFPLSANSAPKKLSLELVTSALYNQGYSYLGTKQGYRDTDVQYEWGSRYTGVIISLYTSNYEKPHVMISFPNINSMDSASKSVASILFQLGESLSGVGEMIGNCYSCNIKYGKNCTCFKVLKRHRVALMASPLFKNKNFIIVEE